MTKGWSAENLPVLVDDASSPTASSPTADDSILPSGQRCWYTDSAGAKVRATVLSVHHDDVVPYYTVKLAGGKERHTTRARLQPKAVSNEVLPLDTAALATATAEREVEAAAVADSEEAARLYAKALRDGSPRRSAPPSAAEKKAAEEKEWREAAAAREARKKQLLERVERQSQQEEAMRERRNSAVGLLAALGGSAKAKAFEEERQEKKA